MSHLQKLIYNMKFSGPNFESFKPKRKQYYKFFSKIKKLTKPSQI